MCLYAPNDNLYDGLFPVHELYNENCTWGVCTGTFTSKYLI